MSKIRFSFLKSQYDETKLDLSGFVVRSGAKIFKFEPEKQRLSICCFPTDQNYISVTQAKPKGYEMKYICNPGETGEHICDNEMPYKESVDIEMSNDNWSAIKKMSDTCGFDYEILS